MLETIINWLLKVVGDLLTWVVQTFLSCLQMDLRTFVNVFPFVADMYKVFQWVAVGLILVIGALSLARFFLGGIEKVEDSPIAILLRSAVAAALVFFGGYLVNWVINILKLPYDAFVDMTDKVVGMSIGSFSGTAVGNTIKSAILMNNTAAAIGAPTVLVIVLVILGLIGWNLIKLVVEILERFVVLGVLAYTAPLAFATMSSSATSEIFKRWCKMLVGQGIIMSLSVASLNIILSGFRYIMFDSVGTGIWIRLLLIFAMCKIALRIDDYMNQLGMNVAHTGDDLMGDIASAFMTLGRIRESVSGGNRRPNEDEILGSHKSLSSVGGLAGGISNAIQKGRMEFQRSGNIADSAGTAGKAFVAGAAKGTFVGAASQGVMKDVGRQRSKYRQEENARMLAADRAGKEDARNESHVRARMMQNKKTKEYDPGKIMNSRNRQAMGTGTFASYTNPNIKNARATGVNQPEGTRASMAGRAGQASNSVPRIGRISDNERNQAIMSGLFRGDPDVARGIKGVDASGNIMTDGNEAQWDKDPNWQFYKTPEEKQAEEARGWNFDLHAAELNDTAMAAGLSTEVRRLGSGENALEYSVITGDEQSIASFVGDHLGKQMDNFSNAVSLQRTISEGSHDAAYLALRGADLSITEPMGKIEAYTVQTAIEKGFDGLTKDIQGHDYRYDNIRILNSEEGGKTYQFNYNTAEGNFVGQRTIVDSKTYESMPDTLKDNFKRAVEIVDDTEFTFYMHDSARDGWMHGETEFQTRMRDYFEEKSVSGQIMTPSKKHNDSGFWKRRRDR